MLGYFGWLDFLQYINPSTIKLFCVKNHVNDAQQEKCKNNILAEGSLGMRESFWQSSSVRDYDCSAKRDFVRLDLLVTLLSLIHPLK